MLSRPVKKISAIGIFLIFSFLLPTLYIQTNLATGQKNEKYEIVSIPCPSLEGSLLDNWDVQKICVMFPVDYSTRNQYPEIYY